MRRQDSEDPLDVKEMDVVAGVYARMRRFIELMRDAADDVDVGRIDLEHGVGLVCIYGGFLKVEVEDLVELTGRKLAAT